MKTITALYPGPIPVTVAGRPRLVEEITIGDVIELQRWLDVRAPRPLDAIRDEIGGLSPAARERALWRAWDALEAPPVEWGSARANEQFETGEGIVEIFRVILRHHYPRLAADHEALLSLVETVANESPRDYGEMYRAWRRIDPQDEIEILTGQYPTPGGKEIGWAQAIVEVSETFGFTRDHIATLPYSVFMAYRAGGKPRERGTSVAPRGGGLKELVRFRKAQYEERNRDNA
jgi:hypothetical protein